MSKITCRRQNKTGNGSELRGACLAFVPSGNPGKPQTVEWALARCKQQHVQAKVTQKRNRQLPSDADNIGFL